MMEMGRIRAFALGAALIFSAASRAAADVITLHNDVRLTGIVSGTSDGGIQLRVSRDGYVLLDSAAVENLERQSRRVNDELESAWIREDERSKREAEAEARFERGQEAKGLTLVDGEWLTAGQLDARSARERLDEERSRWEGPPSYTEIIVNVAPQTVEAVTIGLPLDALGPSDDSNGFRFRGFGFRDFGRPAFQPSPARAFPIPTNPYIPLGDGSRVRRNPL